MSTAINLSRVHLVGIGGAGMSGVARILLERSAIVTGSDAKDSRPVRALRSMGAKVAVGHAAENLRLAGELPTVVVTSFAAIPQDNPELVAAKENGIPVIRRSDLLAELMKGSQQILIAGTHGKTSTTSMTVVAMQAAGLDPSFAIGGNLNRAGTNAHHGTGEAFVAEADESDASLLGYSPNIAVITNIEPDHLDFFETEEKYFRVFGQFAALVPADGKILVCLDDPHAAALAESLAEAGAPVMGYGSAVACAEHPTVPRGAMVTAQEPTAWGRKATIVLDKHTLEVDLQIPGSHMILNATAALLAGYHAGGDLEKLVTGINDFNGVRRRFEYHGTVRGEGPYTNVRVYDDYAHHPTEVTAVLTAAREQVDALGKGKVIAAFQPHLYSRTMEFAEEFARALNLADAAVVLDIYGAREKTVEGVDSRIITQYMLPDSTIFEPDFSAVPARVAQFAGPDDLVLTIGAGSVTMCAPEILHYLQDAQS